MLQFVTIMSIYDIKKKQIKKFLNFYSMIHWFSCGWVFLCQAMQGQVLLEAYYNPFSTLVRDTSNTSSR